MCEFHRGCTPTAITPSVAYDRCLPSISWSIILDNKTKTTTKIVIWKNPSSLCLCVLTPAIFLLVHLNASLGFCEHDGERQIRKFTSIFGGPVVTKPGLREETSYIPSQFCYGLTLSRNVSREDVYQASAQSYIIDTDHK